MALWLEPDGEGLLRRYLTKMDFVEGTTLADVRKGIEADFPPGSADRVRVGVPPAYHFMYRKAPVGTAQEARRAADSEGRVVIIRASGGDSGTTTTATATSATAAASGAAAAAETAVSKPLELARPARSPARGGAPGGAPGTSTNAEGLALGLAQPVVKKNDRTPDIILARVPLFCDPSTGVSTIYVGNGLFPMYVDIRALEGNADAMATLLHSGFAPPRVR